MQCMKAQPANVRAHLHVHRFIQTTIGRVCMPTHKVLLGWLLASCVLFVWGHWHLTVLHHRVHQHQHEMNPLQLKHVWFWRHQEGPHSSSSNQQERVVARAAIKAVPADGSWWTAKQRPAGAAGQAATATTVVKAAVQMQVQAATQQTQSNQEATVVRPHPLPEASSMRIQAPGSSQSKSSVSASNTAPSARQKSSSSYVPSPIHSSSHATSPSSSSNTSSNASKAGSGAALARPSRAWLLRPVLEATERARSDVAYRVKLEQAAGQPINIAVMTGLFWTLPVHQTKDCKVDGIPLNCHIQNGGTEEFLNKADALYYHVPSFSGKPRPKAFPNQLRLAMSLESAAYYPNLDNPAFMCEFDAEMTYRTCAQVTNWYSLEALDLLFEKPPVPFEEKVHAIAYVNSNCAAQSGRSDIMRKLIKLGDKAKVPVHSLGGCDKNTPWPQGNPNKVDVMRKYKFCVAMENSIRLDYLTEKLWDGLVAGCIPIYMGSSNAPQIAPDPNSMIIYDPSGKSGHASTPEQLDAIMHEIGSDKQRYEAMMAWKFRKPEDQPSEVFRYLWGVRHTTGECFLCQFLARHRAEPQPHYTTCLFNQEWMAVAGQKYQPEEAVCPKQPPS